LKINKKSFFFIFLLKKTTFERNKKTYKIMIFPIGDDNVKGGSLPIFSYLFIVLNIAVFGYEVSLPSAQLDAFIENFGAIPIQITMYHTGYQTLITSMFLHGGWMHLIGNMLFLWVFADNIEAVIGNFRFLVFYMVGGILAGLAQVFVAPYSEIPCVGASGAISAVLGAYLVMFPASKIKIWAFVFFTFRVPALLFLVFWGAEQFMSGIGSLSEVVGESGGVAFWAHIGGFVFGIIAGVYYRNTMKTVENYV
jgi:membrane associated rhomboid family serine protease